MKVWLGACSAMSSPVYAANGPQRGAERKDEGARSKPSSLGSWRSGHPDLRVGRPGGLGGVQPARQAAAPACRGVLVHRRGAGDLVDGAGGRVEERLSLFELAGIDRSVEGADGVLDAVLPPAVQGVALDVLTNALL